MTDTKKILDINIPGQEYQIHFGENICRSAITRLKNEIGFERAAVITCENVLKIYEEQIHSFFQQIEIKIITIPDGEAVKHFDTVKFILDQMFEAGLLRSDPVFCIGGGVTGDIGGFCASIYLRGVSVIQIPTTLLSMVDSSVGGKTGVNHGGSKNSVGTFYQPKRILVDAVFLDTLPPKEFNAGMAEIIKHGLIKSSTLFEMIESQKSAVKNRFAANGVNIMFEACKIKASVVEKDEKESGLRKILNFGHTIAHMIESITDYTGYLHGEAVFAGMEFAVYLSMKEGLINSTDGKRIINLLEYFAVPVVLKKDSLDKFLDVVKKDKKNHSQGISFILLEKIGRAKIKNISPDFIVTELNGFLGSGKSKITKLI